MDFDPGAGSRRRPSGSPSKPAKTLAVDLQWAEPWNGVGTDLDAFLLDEGGKVLIAESHRRQHRRNNGTAATGRDRSHGKTNRRLPATVQLAINRFRRRRSPRLKFALLENGRGVSATEYPESARGDVVGPTVFGHAGAASAIAVGAVRYSDSAHSRSATPRAAR